MSTTVYKVRSGTGHICWTGLRQVFDLSATRSRMVTHAQTNADVFRTCGHTQHELPELCFTVINIHTRYNKYQWVCHFVQVQAAPLW